MDYLAHVTDAVSPVIDGHTYTFFTVLLIGVIACVSVCLSYFLRIAAKQGATKFSPEREQFFARRFLRV